MLCKVEGPILELDCLIHSFTLSSRRLCASVTTPSFSNSLVHCQDSLPASSQSSLVDMDQDSELGFPKSVSSCHAGFLIVTPAYLALGTVSFSTQESSATNDG